MGKIHQLQNGATKHKDCLVQELGYDYSSGYAYKGYFCPKHLEAFRVAVPEKKIKDSHAE